MLSQFFFSYAIQDSNRHQPLYRTARCLRQAWKPGVVCVCVFFFPFGFLLQGSGNVGMATPQKLGCILDTVRVVNFVWLQSIHRLQTAAPSTSSTPMTSRCCRCRRALDPCGDHRAACAKEAARVTTNTRIIDLSIHHADTQDDRRIEVIANSLPLSGGAQLALDAPLVSLLTRAGHPRMRTKQRHSLKGREGEQGTHLPPNSSGIGDAASFSLGLK